MRIPKIFIPEKNLGKKIYDLSLEPESPEPEKITEPNTEGLSLYKKIENEAEEVLRKFGKTGMNGMTFKDKKTGLTIERKFLAFGIVQHLTVYCKKCLFKKEKLFESVEKSAKGNSEEYQHLYKRGSWEKDLEQLYISAQQK